MPKESMNDILIELVEKHFEREGVMTLEDWDDISIEAQRRIDA